MKIIKLKFLSKGKTIKKTAIINDQLTELSKSKQNQAIDMVEDDDYWSIIFEEDENTQFEIEFKIDKETFQKTLVPIKAITWFENIIDDVTEVEINIK